MATSDSATAEAPNDAAPAPRSAKVHGQVTDENTSGLRKYQGVVVGSRGLWYTLRYEILTGLLALWPGAIGLMLRKKLYRRLFRRCGRGVVFGFGVNLRHANRIELGDRVVVADGAILDGRSDQDCSVRIGEGSIVGERAVVKCKGGRIDVGRQVGIGSYCSLHAVGDNELIVGDQVLIGHYCYFGGTRYHFDRTDIPIAEQGHDLRGGIRIGEGTWFGARVTVLDGVSIGRHAIVAAGAVVTRDLPDYAIAAGVPARVLRLRTEPPAAPAEQPADPGDDPPADPTHT